MHLYFAFGSNLDPEQMAYRCPEAEFYALATLQDYALCFPVTSSRWNGGGVASIRPETGSSVEGVVYKMNDRDLEHMDGFEGVGKKYERVTVPVRLEDGNMVDAWTYRGLGPDTVHYAPSDAYLNAIRKGAEYFRLSSAFLEMLERHRE